MTELKIVVDDATGKVEVTGPIKQEVLCLGLLEKAKDIILKFNDPQRQPRAEKGPDLLLANGPMTKQFVN